MKNTQDDNAEAVRVGDLVITRIKNRWGLECAGTVESRHGETADVRVWNMNGPGADMLVTGIPLDELTKDRHRTPTCRRPAPCNETGDFRIIM